MQRSSHWLLGRGLPVTALLAVLACHPWPTLPDSLQAVLPAALMLLAFAPLLAALADDPRPRRILLYALVWWGLTVIWLIGLDPVMGFPCWLVTVGLVVGWTWLLGLALCRVRRVWGLDRFLWLAPVVWCGWEKLKGHTSLVSPWGSAFTAFWKLPVLAQIVEVSGPFLLSFVILTVNAGLARVLLRRRDDRLQLAVGLGLLLGLAFYGTVRLASFDADAGPRITCALVQPNVSFHDKRVLDPVLLFTDAVRLTQDVRPGTDLTIWPETTAPWIGLNPPFRLQTGALARGLRTTLLAGTIHTCRGDGSWEPALLNGALAFGPDGAMVGFQGKVRIVPFGEYTPGRRHWPFKLIARKSPQFFGSRRHRAMATAAGRLGLAICFESIFPADARAVVRDGAQVLVAMTNDDQLLRTGAFQHYQQAVFRSIETRRWQARCANGGVSATIDPTGRVRARTGWKQRTVLQSEVHLRDGQTPFVRFGDWFGWLSVIIAIGAVWGPPSAPRSTSGQSARVKDGEHGQGTDRST